MIVRKKKIICRNDVRYKNTNSYYWQNKLTDFFLQQYCCYLENIIATIHRTIVDKCTKIIFHQKTCLGMTESDRRWGTVVQSETVILLWPSKKNGTTIVAKVRYGTSTVPYRYQIYKFRILFIFLTGTKYCTVNSFFVFVFSVFWNVISVGKNQFNGVWSTNHFLLAIARWSQTLNLVPRYYTKK